MRSVAVLALVAVAHAPGLVVSYDGRIWVEGRSVARGEEPAWSPDGTRIAFQRAGDVYVVDRDGRNEPAADADRLRGLSCLVAGRGSGRLLGRSRDLHSPPPRPQAHAAHADVEAGAPGLHAGVLAERGDDRVLA
jgi:hypothetical protein